MVEFEKRTGLEMTLRTATILSALWLGGLFGLWGCDPEPPVDGDADIEDDADVTVCDPAEECCSAADCTDGIFCNGVERCVEGECELGEPIDCDDGLACTTDECDEYSNLCVYEPDNSACDDDDLCNGTERCEPADSDADEEGCIQGLPLICDDGDDCTTDFCDDNECRARVRDGDGDGHGDRTCQVCSPDDPEDCVRGDDCDDDDESVYPGAAEICDDGRDNNCDRDRDYEDRSCDVPNDSCAELMLLEPEVTVRGSTRRTSGDVDSSCSAASDYDVVFGFAIMEAQDVELAIEGSGRDLTVALSSDCDNPEGDLRCTTGRDFTQIHRALPAGTYYVVVSSEYETDFALTLSHYTPLPRPEGDQCSTAVDVSAGGIFTGTTEGFDPDYETSCGEVTNLDATFAVTVTETSSMNLSVLGAEDELAVAVQSTCGLVSSEQVCFDGVPASGWVSHLSPGTHYIIVSSARAQDFTLDIELLPGAADGCAAARDISEGGSFSGTTRAMAADIATSCGDEEGPDSVYSFVLTEAQDVTVDFLSSGEEMTLSLSSACDDPDADLRCSSGTSFQMRGRGLPPGEYFLVTTGERGEDYELDLSSSDPVPLPPGDLCTDAIDVTGGGTAIAGDTTASENDYDSRCGDATDLDVAFQFTLTEEVSMDLSVTADTGPITVSVQRTCGVLGTERGCFTAETTGSRHYRSLAPGTYYLIFKTPSADTFTFDLSFGEPEEWIPLPFIGLPYDFYAWDAEAADLVYRAVTYGYASEPIVAGVSDCADTTGSTSPGNPGGSSSGEFNSTLDALRYAGMLDSSIIEVVDASEAEALVGTYDVLLFVEFESCTPSAAGWRSAVEAHLAGGGRVVSTYPGASGAAFINDLGFFGSGSSGSPASPFVALTTHDFWDGIVHPGHHSATSAWRWSGPGLVPLGHSSTDDSLYTVVGYEVE